MRFDRSGKRSVTPARPVMGYRDIVVPGHGDRFSRTGDGDYVLKGVRNESGATMHVV